MSETVNQIRERYKTKYLEAESAAEMRRAEVEMRVPGIREAHLRMQQTGLALLGSVFNKDQTVGDLDTYRAEIEQLRGECARLLTEAGYPADYDSIKYECALCGDTGYLEDGQMCKCLKRELTRARILTSGMGERMRTQNFANFSLRYYTQGEERDRMQYCLDALRAYAYDFTPKTAANLLLLGNTGLGKTHLSSAVAGVVLEKGYDVCYVNATRLIGDFEKQRFGAGNGNLNGETDHYFVADFLILDDLGTEVSNQFTASCLYDLITRRMDTEKPTLISTNLTPAELRKRYWDRITSRLLGEYRLLPFVGKDVRMQKLMEGAES